MLEDLDLLLDPLIRDGKEAVGSMGDDAPPAVLSALPRPLSHYFRQNFSQVTNPPIDPLREAGAMSLKTRFKNLGNILAEEEAQTDVFVLDSPVLTTGMYERMLDTVGAGATAVIGAREGRPGAGLRSRPAERPVYEVVCRTMSRKYPWTRTSSVISARYTAATRCCLSMMIVAGTTDVGKPRRAATAALLGSQIDG